MRAWLFAAMVVPALMASAAMAQGSAANNTGNCVVIIQGNGNSATINGCDPMPTYPPEPHYYHIWQTPNLGIRFEQDGKWVPLFPVQSSSKLVVDLAPKPFIIWVPDDHWPNPASDMPALQISVSWDVALLGLSSADLFAPGSGVAADARGNGRLFMADPTDMIRGHNYIIGHRFDRKMTQWRGLFVSLIDIGQPTGDNLIEPGSRGFMVFLMQEDDTPAMPGYTKRSVPIGDAPRDDIQLEFGGRQ